MGGGSTVSNKKESKFLIFQRRPRERDVAQLVFLVIEAAAGQAAALVGRAVADVEVGGRRAGVGGEIVRNGAG